jgi:methyl-accepting chemotaxis protein
MLAKADNVPTAPNARAAVVPVIGEISCASEEQGRGIEQVDVAVSQMDQVTQRNAALVEEVAAAQSLEEQAARLKQMVSVFTVPM